MSSSRGFKLAALTSEPAETGAFRRAETDEHPIGTGARIDAELGPLGRDEFLAMLAHELRNPLAPIRTAVQVFREVELSDTRLESARDTIERQVDQLSRLVDDLVEVARLTRGLIQLRGERIAIDRVVTEAVDACRPLIASKEHTLALDLGDEVLLVEGDALRLTQALASLLDNAAKYTERGGRITLSARRSGGEVQLSVRDSGVGMPPELVARAFEMFEQGRRPLDRSQGGLGLGLTLVRRLIEMHGGSVEAHSEGVNQGSEFTIWLPLASTERPAAVPQRAIQVPAPKAGSYRVLVVDDNLDGAESLELLLRFWHHDARSTHDPHEALAIASSFRPQIALLDIGLPGMSGYELARRLRSLPALAGTTLIALTGYGGEDDRRRSREAGFDQHLVKPATPAMLRRLFAAEDKRRAPQ